MLRAFGAIGNRQGSAHHYRSSEDGRIDRRQISEGGRRRALAYILIYTEPKLFTNGRSQAVRLPAVYRFDGKEVFIRRDPQTGDLILSRKPATWDGFFAALKGVAVPVDFLDASERDRGEQQRDPFMEWRE